jgi:hypothetical protein
VAVPMLRRQLAIRAGSTSDLVDASRKDPSAVQWICYLCDIEGWARDDVPIEQIHCPECLEPVRRLRDWQELSIWPRHEP